MKIGNLKNHETSKQEIETMLRAVKRNLTDAAVDAVSCENRFDSAYKAIRLLADVALMANGFRTSSQSSHLTAIQTLTSTIGLANDRMVVLDAMRRQRNLSDYTGDPVYEEQMNGCIEEAEALLKDVDVWLQENRPDLL